MEAALDKSTSLSLCLAKHQWKHGRFLLGTRLHSNLAPMSRQGANEMRSTAKVAKAWPGAACHKLEETEPRTPRHSSDTLSVDNSARLVFLQKDPIAGKGRARRGAFCWSCVLFRLKPHACQNFRLQLESQMLSQSPSLCEGGGDDRFPPR
jgi:hypothetical protein